MLTVPQAMESALRAPRTLTEQVLHNEVLRLRKLNVDAEAKLLSQSEALKTASEKMKDFGERVTRLEAKPPMSEDIEIEAPSQDNATEPEPVAPVEEPAPVPVPVPEPVKAEEPEFETKAPEPTDLLPALPAKELGEVETPVEAPVPAAAPAQEFVEEPAPASEAAPQS